MKLNKCMSLFLTLLVLVSNIGIAINVHYCGARISGISVQNVARSPVSGCCSKKETGHKSCCRDKVFKISKKSDFTVKAFSFHTDFTCAAIERRPICITVPLAQANKNSTYFCEAHGPPLFKLYSHYIFYA